MRTMDYDECKIDSYDSGSGKVVFEDEVGSSCSFEHCMICMVASLRLEVESVMPCARDKIVSDRDP